MIKNKLKSNIENPLPNLLIVDDNEKNLFALNKILEKLEVKVYQANSGNEALSFLIRHEFAMTILDVQMPVMNGFELAAMMREQNKLKETPILFLTAHSKGKEHINKGYKLGAVDYLFKPIDTDILITKVKFILELYYQKEALKKQVNYRVIAERSLKQTITKLNISNRELEQYAYVTSHDLKAPMTNLASLVSMMEAKEQFTDDIKFLFEKIKTSIHQMEETFTSLNEVIAFKESFNLKKEKLSFNTIFNEVKESIANQITTSQAKIKANFSTCANIDYPLVHLKSIMQNLLTNAIKYKLADKDPIIDIKTTIDGDQICLIVQDNGLGIDLKAQEDKLFGLFKRFHTHVEGKGVGLHIVKSIVDSHGGKIEVESELNKGTTFKIYLNNGNTS